MEGHAKVEALASFLASLRLDPSNVLTNQQADRIVDLWQNLSDYDKQPICFRPLYKGGPPKGRFRAAKAAKSAEVEATQRYLSWIYVSTLPLFASTFQIDITGKSSFLYCITQVRVVFCTVSLR